jgi:hypothetical protein
MTMNTTLTKFLLPLAALAFGSVACDPFPEAPGGDPAIVRVVTYGGSLGTSNTVETVTGGNTVTSDLAEPDSIIRVQFNKPMDGSSIQLYPQYNADGTPFVPPGGADPCTPATAFDVSDFPAGTLVCYDPSSSTDGGSAVIYPGAELAYGTTYNVAGTVRDYEGKSLTLNVSVTVDPRPIPFALDGYTAGVDWFDSLADSYEVFWSPTGVAGSYVSLAVIDPAVDCDGVMCEALQFELVPHTDYWYQVTETTGTTTITRPAAQAPASTFGALTPTLGVVSTTTVPPTIIPGIIRVAWGSTQGSNGYDVETSTDGTTWSLYSHHTAASRVVYYGTPAPGTTVPTAPGTLTPGTTYYFRVTPTFASGFVAEKGNVASKVSP